MMDRLEAWWFAPQSISRLTILRVLVPLFVLGFLSSRIAHADFWIGTRGIHLPELDNDYRQPAHLPRLLPATAWVLVSVMVAAGLAFAAGAFTRVSGAIFAACLVWVALADRLEALTVSKLGPVLVLALIATPCGEQLGVDAWRAARRGHPPPTHVSWGNVRFFQGMLVVFYLASGLCKARGDWMSRSDVLWTQLHDSYQTPITVLVANTFPVWSWAVLQGITLGYEALAPIWFSNKWTRPFALGYGLSMHLMIGLMFGPVVWFSLLMMTLLCACFLPTRWLDLTVGRLASRAAPTLG